MGRKFRPLEDSIAIVEKMLNVAEYYGDPSEIQYWTKRLHGYQKLLNQQKRQSFMEAHP